jgi:hypothetical protein
MLLGLTLVIWARDFDIPRRQVATASVLFHVGKSSLLEATAPVDVDVYKDGALLRCR